MEKDANNEMMDMTSINPESILGIVTKINRIERLLEKPSDRDNVSISNIKNSLAIYSLIVNIISAMSNVDDKLITSNLVENIASLDVSLKILIDRGLEEYDSQSVKPLISTLKVVKTNLLWIIGRWFTTHDLGETTNGDYTDILKTVIMSCLNSGEFLGV